MMCYNRALTNVITLFVVFLTLVLSRKLRPKKLKKAPVIKSTKAPIIKSMKKSRAGAQETSTSPSPAIQSFPNDNFILKTAVTDYIAGSWTGYIGDVYHGYVKRRLFASLQNETHRHMLIFFSIDTFSTVPTLQTGMLVWSPILPRSSLFKAPSMKTLERGTCRVEPLS
jgi:hypothetical protein